jgi:glycosyltransferase involved in cell wall biosynthesis
MRLAVLQNIVAPTRHALFRALAERVDLTVLFMARTEPARGWSGREDIDYPHRFLRGVHVPLPVDGDVDAAHVNPGVWNAIVRGGYDALLCGGWISPTTWLARAACGRSGTRFVLWSGTAWPSDGVRAALGKPLKRAMVSGAHGYVAYGSDARDRLLELGAPPERITIALNTTDVLAFAGATRKAEGPTALWVGRFVRRKRADRAVRVLARAAEHIPGLKATFVGDGPERAATEALAAELGLDARFLGDLPYGRLPDVYAGASVLVTLAEREPWGLVVNEALAAGVPVVATPGVTAARELVPAGAGVVSASDLELAAAVARLAGDERASAAAAAVLPRLLPDVWADTVVAACAAATRRL